MMDREFLRGTAVAAAVMGLLFATGCGGDEDERTSESAQPVKCLGGNECAGMSECAGGPSGNECKGMNECMAMGWDYKDTAAECEAAGGMVQT